MFKNNVGLSCVIVFLLLIFGGVAKGQLNVQSRLSAENNFRIVDQTLEVTFRVINNTGAALTNVVPTLIPPDCTDGSGNPLFNTTFKSANISSSITSPVIASWPNGETRDLTFFVHLFHSSQYCDSFSSVCSGPLDFRLEYTYQGQGTPQVAQDSTNALGFDDPPADGFTVVDVHSRTPSTSCCSHASASFTIPTQAQSFVNSPETRVLLGVDWNLHINPPSPPLSFASGIGEFNYPLNGTAFYPLRSRVLGGQVSMIAQGVSIFDQNGEPFQLGPLGGTGSLGNVNCGLESWNFFDITDQPVSGGTVKQVLGSVSGNSQIGCLLSSTQVNFREAGIFLAVEGGCGESQAFGPPPAAGDFRIGDFHIISSGQALVRAFVPTAWANGAGTELNGNYTLEWFVRGDGAYTKASKAGGGATDPRVLTETINLPGLSLPSDFAIEARVTHVSTGAVVSVVSAKHDLAYSGLGSGFFLNAEETPDQFLDPGESLVVPLSLQNNIGRVANNLTVTLEVLGPAGATFGFDSEALTESFAGLTSDIVYFNDLGIGADLDLNLHYQLLEMTQGCEDIDLSLKVGYQDSGLNSSYRYFFTVPGNCQLEPDTVGINLNDWTPSDCFGNPNPCQDSNCTQFSCISTTNGWAYTGGNWSGLTDTPFLFYTLEGPAFPVGSNPSIHMRHIADFLLLTAGGILEFRTRNSGGAWSLWQDLIEPIENAQGVDLYNTRLYGSAFFLPGTDKMISDRHVFMDMDQVQEWTYDVPPGLFNQDEVMFRFLFQQPNLNGSSAGTWTIEAFDYSSDFPVADNLFGVPSGLSFSSCLPTITITPGVPGNYQYDWFDSLQDLIDGTPDFVSFDGVWIGYPLPAEDETYYVRITDTDSMTSRVYSFTVIAENDVPSFFVVVEAWYDPNFPASADINMDGEVDVLDIAEQVILNQCE